MRPSLLDSPLDELGVLLDKDCRSLLPHICVVLSLFSGLLVPCFTKNNEEEIEREGGIKKAKVYAYCGSFLLP